MMRIWRCAVAPLLAFNLVSCGGSDSATQPNTQIPTTPAPTPTSVPTPISTPTPLPSPTIRAYSSDVIAGEYFFVDVPNGITAQGFGSRDGFYYPGFKGQLLTFSRSFNRPADSDFTDYEKSFEGYDRITSRFVWLAGPKSARVLTPLTTMLSMGDQAKLKRQFGITGQPFGFQYSDPDLLTYDAITALASGTAAEKQDALKMLGFHIRALELGLVFDYLGLGPNPYQGNVPQYPMAGSYLSVLPDRYVFNDADLVSAFTNASSSYGNNFRPDVLLAVAHLVNVYADTVSREITPSNVAQYTNGVYGFLLENVERLLRENSNSAAAEAMLIDSSIVKTQTSKYANSLFSSSTGTLFASTNFYATRSGIPLTLNKEYSARSKYEQLSYFPSLDDWQVNTNNPYASAQRSSPQQLISVSVPQENANDITVQSMPDGTVIVTPVGAFRGVTYFDYVAGALNGEQQIGRAFVTVRP